MLSFIQTFFSSASHHSFYYVLAWLSGALGALAWSSAWWPLPVVLPVGIGMLSIGIWWSLLYQKHQSLWQVTVISWFWGFGLWMTSLYWIGNSLWIDPLRFAWLWPFSITLIPAYLALYSAISAWMGISIWKTLPRLRSIGRYWIARLGTTSLCLQNPSRIPSITPLSQEKSVIIFSLLLAGSFSLWEYGRSFLFTGFPWNLVAYWWQTHPFLGPLESCLNTWLWNPPLFQSVAIWGSFGLGFLTLVLTAFIWSCYTLWKTTSFRSYAMTIWGWIMLIFYGITLQWSAEYLHNHPTKWRPIELRLVQTSAAFSLWHDDQEASNTLETLLGLSTLSFPQKPPLTGMDFPEKRGPSPDIVIWPEGSFSWSIYQSMLRDIRHWLPSVPLLLFEGTFHPIVCQASGTSAKALASKKDLETYWMHGENSPWNALLGQSFSRDPKTFFLYAKRRLLPFGEYIPFRRQLEKWMPRHWLQSISQGENEYRPGLKSSWIKIENFPAFYCAICYEAVFPGLSACNTSKEPAQWILNLTNDAWFYDSMGPYQHFSAARARSVEEGLPLIRAAHSGISAVMDGCGRICAYLPYNAVGVLDSRLPSPLPKTLYALYGESTWLGLMGGIFLAILWMLLL